MEGTKRHTARISTQGVFVERGMCLGSRKRTTSCHLGLPPFDIHAYLPYLSKKCQPLAPKLINIYLSGRPLCRSQLTCVHVTVTPVTFCRLLLVTVPIFTGQLAVIAVRGKPRPQNNRPPYFSIHRPGHPGFQAHCNLLDASSEIRSCIHCVWLIFLAFNYTFWFPLTPFLGMNRW